ncbi:hypothetical protein PR048_000549 [Dryococelus australis]|uniref:Uncharacterized protein n=1 Tax=Dryococelus australis TaxID=614101 RepID=A0ABQ9IG67_9NEOP|nr:hypothetical protein PR048_000549 [Dryococelus australis]
MFEPLKLKFQSREKCPNVIKILLGNPLFEAWLWFIHSQASTFHNSVKLIEEKSMLLKLEQEGYITKEEVSNFHTPTKLFCNIWRNGVLHLKIYRHGWVMLKTTPIWENIEKTEEFIKTTVPSVKVKEKKLYNEYVYVKQYVINWKEMKTLPENKWVEIFTHFSKNDVPSSNMLKIVEFLLCLPGTNAPTE